MTVLNVILFAVAAFFGSFVVLGAAWLLTRGRAAAVRHLIWTGAFAVLLALPVAAALLPSQLTWELAAPATPSAEPAATPVVVAAPVAASGIDAADIVLAVAAVWLLGVLFHLVRLAVGGVGLIVLHRRSVAHIPHGIDDAPFRGLNWQLRLRTSPGEAGPLTWGVLRPVVLLPKASVTWPRERLTSVLLHEASHVRRKDCLARLITAISCAFYWPNPLVWFAARAQRADGECAADDCVLTMGVRPTRYAEHLVGLAREFSGGAYAMTLSMADRAALDSRVEAILDPTQSRTGVTKMDVLKIAALGLTLTSALALARPSLAEPATDPAPVVKSDQVAPLAKGTDQTVIVDKPVKHRIVRQIVLRDGPPDAPQPPEPPMPPDAPPPPEAAPAPPAPPAHVRTQVHVMISDADKAALHQLASAETKRAMAEARRAIADAHIDQVIAEAMKKAEVAMANGHRAEAEAQKAVAAAHIDRVVEEAMKKAEVALKHAQVKIVVTRKRIDQDGEENDADLPDADE